MWEVPLVRRVWKWVLRWIVRSSEAVLGAGSRVDEGRDERRSEALWLQPPTATATDAPGRGHVSSYLLQACAQMRAREGKYGAIEVLNHAGG